MDKQRIRKAAEWLSSSKSIAVITGAGVSTESGIPDFRSSGGLYNKQTNLTTPLEEVLSHHYFEQEPAQFYAFYRENLLRKEAQPNPGHVFLADIEKMGKEVTVITQNIDSLHQKAGSSKVIELHGSTARVVSRNGTVYSYEEAVESETAMHVGREWVRPDVTLYGEMLDPEAISRSVKAVSQADVLLVLGTSLNVYPAAGFVYDFQGDHSILVNKGRTGLSYPFGLSFKTSISQWAEAVKNELT